MLEPKFTAFGTFVPEVAEDTLVLAGLFLVTCVGLAVRFAVVQVTDELQVDEPFGMVQEVAEMVPEGEAPELTVTSVHRLQLLPSSDSVIVPALKELFLSAQARTEYVPADGKE